MDLEKIINLIVEDLQKNAMPFKKYAYEVKSTHQIIRKHLTKQLRLNGVTKRNWFEKLPLHWKLALHLIGGIIMGLMLPYVW